MVCFITTKLFPCYILRNKFCEPSATIIICEILIIAESKRVTQLLEVVGDLSIVCQTHTSFL